MVEPVLKEYLEQDPACKVVLLEPSAGTGMFTGELQQLASKYLHKYTGRVEVKAYELCPGQAAIANALGHTTTGGWNSLLNEKGALDRVTFTGGHANTKLVVVGNPPYGRHGASVVSGTAEATEHEHLPQYTGRLQSESVLSPQRRCPGCSHACAKYVDAYMALNDNFERLVTAWLCELVSSWWLSAGATGICVGLYHRGLCQLHAKVA
jgi:hypothetical protein